MRKMYTTKRLLGTVTCAAALIVATPTFAQKGAPAAAVEEELFDADGQAKEDQKVEVGETGEIDLHVKELEITKVLQLLSIQSQKNIIASRGVENAKVSADLYGVSFDEALKSILEPNGFGYVQEGNFIYVLTTEELAKRKSADRKLTVTIHNLDYMRAEDAARFVSPMLSDAGTITASGNVIDGIQATVDDAGADAYSGPATLVIRDYEDQVEAILDVLKQLDKQPKQVIIEATILNASLSENNQFGVDFSLFTDLTGASPLDIIDGAISGGKPGSARFGAAQSNVGNVAGQNGGVKLGFVAGDISVFVSALDSVTDTTVIATPKTTVLDRNRADIQVGERVPFLTTTVSETTSTQTIEFLDTGTQLSVRPFVARDGKIRLELRPSVSSAESVDVGGGQLAPQEDTVQMITNVIVDSGQTIVLGGLFTDSTSVGRSQVPGLGSIPLLGAAFRGQTDVVGRSEIIFMVKATIVENDVLNSIGKEAESRMDVARLAERQGTLPWSRSKLTAAHMVNARKYYDQAMTLTGPERDDKMAEARFCVDLALHMNPSMVDALMLKEQITGEASYIKYEESIINQTYDAVLSEEMKALGLPELPVSKAPTQGNSGKGAPQLIEPEPLAQAPTDTAADSVAQAAHDATNAEQDKAAGEAEQDWLDAVLADGSEETTDEAAAPADESIEQATAEAETEAEFIVELDDADFEVVEEADTAQAQAEDETSWRELSTEELLKLAAEAAEESDGEQAGVETETD